MGRKDSWSEGEKWFYLRKNIPKVVCLSYVQFMKNLSLGNELGILPPSSLVNSNDKNQWFLFDATCIKFKNQIYQSDLIISFISTSSYKLSRQLDNIIKYYLNIEQP